LTAFAVAFDVKIASGACSEHVPVVVGCRSCRFRLLTVNMPRDADVVAEHFYSTGHVDFSVERADKVVMNGGD
jgi:hypothetical protein